MSTIGGSSAATSTTAGMVSGVKGASGSLNPTATNFVPPPLGVRLDGGGHGAQDSGRKSKADPWADQFEWMDKSLTREAAASVAFMCSALDRLSEVAKKHGHKLISIEIGSMKVVLELGRR